MNPTTPTADFLHYLVKDNLSGARLLNFYQTDANATEKVFVVIWERGEEHGTHRACVRHDLTEGMLVWGHYHRGRRALVEAYKDYNDRIARQM